MISFLTDKLRKKNVFISIGSSFLQILFDFFFQLLKLRKIRRKN